MVLLTEGRGGRYAEDGTGRLRYLPSGREPVLYAGSRRGVPFPPKPTHVLAAPPPPRFFDAAAILRGTTGELDFFRDVWPHAAKEIGWGYYHELFLAHPDRVHGDLETFARAYAATETGSAEERRLVRATVPDPADVFDLAHLDRPLSGERFPHRAALGRRITAHVERTLRRAADARHSADAGAVAGALTVFGQLPVLMRSGRLAVRSWASDVDGWWAGLFTHLASGPPPRRLRELLALTEAGLVRFTGPDTAVHTVGGRFAASSPAVPGAVTARAFVEARLPVGAMPAPTDPLVAALYRRRRLCEHVGVDGGFRHRTGLAAVDGRDGAVLDAAGRPQPRLFALGPFTTAPAGGNFTRPGANPLPSRLTDALSRAALRAAGASLR